MIINILFSVHVHVQKVTEEIIAIMQILNLPGSHLNLGFATLIAKLTSALLAPSCPNFLLISVIYYCVVNL